MSGTFGYDDEGIKEPPTPPNFRHSETVFLAPSIIHFACGRAGCTIRVAIGHPGYTLVYPIGDEAARERARDEAWEGIMEVWRHGGECRTFSQAELRAGAAAEWIDGLHARGAA